MLVAKPIENYVITGHATMEMTRRNIGLEIVEKVLAAPNQRESVRPGRDVAQSKIEIGGKSYLIRVFVDIDRAPAEVVTVYRTRKIEKYWRLDP